LLGGVATNIGHDNTVWTSTKTLDGASNLPTNNAGTISWTVTVTKQSVSDKTLEVDGVLSVQNTGSNDATIGNVIVNLQKFRKKCGSFKNIWVSVAADMADGDNDIFATTDNIVAAASQEVVNANKVTACGPGNYTTSPIPNAKALMGTFITTSGSGALAFDYSPSIPVFAIGEPNNVIPAGDTRTFIYQATFDNSNILLNPGDQIRTETIVTFGNAGARGGSGASAPGFEIDGGGLLDTADIPLYVRSVPTRTSMQVSAVCIHCNQLVTITDDASDISTTGDVSDDDSFNFVVLSDPQGAASPNPDLDPFSFVIDGSKLDASNITKNSVTFTASVLFSVLDCSSGSISNTAHLLTYQFPLDGSVQGLTNPPYSWDVNGDLLFTFNDLFGNPTTVVLCVGFEQDPSDVENVVSDDTQCNINPPPPPPPPTGCCTYLQSEWTHHPGDDVLTALMPTLPGGTETIGTFPTFHSKWDSSAAVEAYLPAGGTNGALTANLTDPPKNTTPPGHLGGDILALALNVDLGASNLSTCSLGHFGDLHICGTGTAFDGMTVADFLSAANTAVGGGALPSGFTFNGLSDFATHLNVSFQQCHETGFAKNHLVDGPCPVTP
jgi:hypothetical protein